MRNSETETSIRLEGILGLMGERGVKNDFKLETKGEIE